MSFAELRKKSGLSQKNLAIRLNKKQSTISMWENANSKPRSADFKLIALELKTTIEVVFDCFDK